MTKLIGVCFLCSALICSMPGVASAQFYPPVAILMPLTDFRAPTTTTPAAGV